MITFLRKIRRSLIGSGHVKKYTLYAIGEILLVMIGILLALQVNNWNEERKARQLELVTLTELRKNIEANANEIEEKFKDVNTRLNAIKIILNSFSNQTALDDSLNKHFGWAMIYDRINLHVGTYESLISSGSQIISDEELRFEISTYFDATLGSLEGYMRELRDDFYSYMLGYLRNEFQYYSASDHIGIPKDIERLRQNETFKLSLGIYLDVQKDAMKSLEVTKQQSLELLEKIDIRINQIDD